MSGRWNHSICEKCWNEKNPDREPIRIREEFRDEKPEACCFCSSPHNSGIYVRQDPNLTACRGQHETTLVLRMLLDSEVRFR